MEDAKPSGDAPRLSLGRKLLFTLVTLVLFIGGLEGLAAVLEPIYFPYKRSLPIAAPGAPGAWDFGFKADEVRRAMDPEQRPTLQKMEIPLVGDTHRRWALPANTELNIGGVGVRINELGMRGGAYEVVDGEVRIFTLGDSSVFGDGLEEPDVFSTVAAGLLAKAWNRKVQGMIGAVPGHDTGQSLSTLQVFGPRLKPSWVVIGNLWSDVYRAEGADKVEAYTYLPPVKGILRNSALYRLVWRFYSPWLNAQQVRWLEGRQDVGTDVDSGTRVPLRQYIKNLKKMAKVARGTGARVAFLILPAPMDFDQAPVPDTVQRYRFAMKAVAEEEGAPILDSPALYKARGGNISYFADQVHPNSDGHFLLGQGLAELLEPFGPPPEGSSHYEGYAPDPSMTPAPLNKYFTNPKGSGPGHSNGELLPPKPPGEEERLLQ